MDSLIAELEQAQEGSRILDYRIAYGDAYKGMAAGDLMGAPHYTTNLQDALGLVPEGYSWQLKYWGSAKRCQGWVQLMSYDGFDSEGHSPALALTIASLKARREA